MTQSAVDFESAITIPSMPALLLTDITSIEDAVTGECTPIARDVAPATTGSTRALRAHSAPLAWRVAAFARAMTTPWWCACSAPVEAGARCLTCGGEL